MRIIQCPTCRQLTTARGTCRSCADLADLFAQLQQPNAGQAIVYPFAALRRLSPDARREISAAIAQAQAVAPSEVSPLIRAESTAALDETVRGLREDAD